MNLILFDDTLRNQLLPFTFTRPVAEIRLGILTISEKWARLLHTNPSYFTQDYLSEKFPLIIQNENLFLNGSVLPDEKLLAEVAQLKPGEALVQGALLLAAKLGKADAEKFPVTDYLHKKEFGGMLLKISALSDIFSRNDEAIRRDIVLMTKGRTSQPISSSNKVMGSEPIFLEEGAKVECSILNASTGPIYIGKDAEVMEGCMIRGPFVLGEYAQLKMGAKIYGATTIGPHCKVGGEVNNSVIFGYSNKAHDGFLGNSVIGEWCNIGADSNNSNLKNNYAEVKLWNYEKKSFTKTGLQFCGLMMGDHSKCGINTMFNTGTVVGVSANIFGAGFPRNFIPDFSWGGASGFEVFALTKAYEIAEKVFERRSKVFDEKEKKILAEIFESTKEFRFF